MGDVNPVTMKAGEGRLLCTKSHLDNKLVIEYFNFTLFHDREKF